MNEQIASCLDSASWIRRMFEEGAKLREQYGAENVYDFSLGNPHLEPPAEIVDKLRQLAAEPPQGVHRYMPNAGFPEVRERVADFVGKLQGVATPASHVVMVCGAASGLNVALRTLINPGEKVLLLKPIFAEYRFYAMHQGAQAVLVDSTADFDVDLEQVERAIDATTRVLMLNSPNNPTGRVYPAATIHALCELLTRKSREFGKPIYLLSDEPYRRLVYDGVQVPALFPHYPNTIIVASFSKDLGLAGERIGYLAVHPELENAAQILSGMVFCLRTMGFVNAPAMIQLAVAEGLHATVDVDAYRRNRDLLYGGLQEIGYEVVKPEGAFYLFPKSPVADDTRFIRRLQQERVLAVPGTGFAQPGYFRLSYAVEPEVIERALPAFERALRAE